MLSENKMRRAVQGFDEYGDKRAQRLLQLALVCVLGIGLAALFARGSTKPILITAMLAMMLSGWFAWRKQILLSATVLLVDLTVMLSVLVWVSGGVHDIAMLGYPMILVMAAILGNVYLFLGLLAVIVLYCTVVAVLTVKGEFVMIFPDMTYAHAMYVDIILLITGFGVYILVMDLHRLMTSLREENARVIERERLIVQLANRDQLTDLHNRRYAEHQFSDFLSHAYKKRQRVALFFLDLDNFKPVNDSLGHAAGDVLLRQLSQRLQAIASPEDILCRFGGDEFLWIKAIDYAHPEAAKQRLEEAAKALLEASSKSFFIMENKIDISATVGISIAPKDGETFLELSRCADLAMYHAKTKGRNTHHFYSEDLSRISIDKYHLLKRMREALSKREFQLWYQPKLSLASGQVTSCEALLRWPQADGRFIYPEDFIPLAESSGLIAEIGQWVLEQACLDCHAWQQEGYKQVGVAVNVSYVQFRDGTLPESVEQVLKKTGLQAKHLELELTESLLINDEDDIQHQLNSINEMGISLAIDDFGTGYSNLGYLRNFNARCLKIDKSFITTLGISERDEPLVKAMVQMAHSLNLKITAEGVEDERVVRKLIELGCDEGQGYYWSKPVPLHEWRQYLQQQASPYALLEQPTLH